VAGDHSRGDGQTRWLSCDARWERVGEHANQLAAPEGEQLGGTTLRLARVLLVTIGDPKRPFVLLNEIFVAH
jgi:hypothetical protein